VEGSGHTREAGVEQRLVGAELRGEAVAGVDARRLSLAAERGLECGVLADAAVEFYELIADRARGLMRQAITQGWGSLQPADAIHLATAQQLVMAP